MIEAKKTPLILSLDDDLAMHAVYNQLAIGLDAHHKNFDTIESLLNHLKAAMRPAEVIIFDRFLPDGDGLECAAFARDTIPNLEKRIS